MKAIPIIVLVCTTAFSLMAGDTFYWIANRRSWAKYPSSSNWSLQKDSYSNPDGRIPSPEDTIWNYGSVVSGDYGNYLGYFDLDGGSYTIAGYSNGSEAGTAWKSYQIHLTNGTFTVINPFAPAHPKSSDSTTHGYYVYDSATLLFPANGTAVQIGVSGLEEQLTVKRGGRMEWRKGSVMFSTAISIESGGEMVFAPESFDVNQAAQNPTQGHYCRLTNKGVLRMPNGLIWAGTITGNTGGKSFSVRQNAGTLYIGGDFTKTTESVNKAASLNFTFSGGTIVATNSVVFRNATKNFAQEVFPSMPDAASGSVEVCTDSVLDMQLFTYGTGTILSKTGPGTLVIGTTRPVSLAVNAGTLRLGAATADLSGITLAAGTRIEFAAPDNSFAAPTGYTDIDFSVDTTSGNLWDGAVFFSSDDAAFLAYVKTHVEANLPEGYEISQEGNVLLLEHVPLLPTFTSDGELDISAAAGWGGTVPESGDVIVSGSGTVALVGTSPAFDSIMVRKGATLKVTGSGVDLPPITLVYPARIVFADGSSSTATAGFTGMGSASGLPIVEIATNATVTVPRGTKFKNLNFRLYGQIGMPNGALSDNSLVFGHAESGETSYFAMTSVGGTIYAAGNSDGTGVTGAWRRFCVPEVGGRVVAIGPIVLKDVAFTPTTSTYNGIAIGYNNPEDEPFEVVLDRTVIPLSRGCYFGGAATIRCINGGALEKNTQHPGVATALHMSGKVRFVAEGEGSRITYSNSASNNPKMQYHFNINPGQDSFDAIILKDGAYMSTHETVGNGKACLVVSNAAWCIPTLPYVPWDNNPSPPGDDPKNWMTNSFNGFKSVRIEPESAMYLESAALLGGTAWNRDVKLANVPITGAGDLVMTNGTPGYTFRVTVVATNNTATGVAKAVCGVGGDATTLLFNDGANWAGTVVAGNIALTNVTDSAAPATATFGTLRLDGEFPVRVWATTNDMVNISGFISGDGAIVPVPMDGRVFETGDSFTLGTCPADAMLPLRIGRKWRVVKIATGDPDVAMVKLMFAPRGISVSFK